MIPVDLNACRQRLEQSGVDGLLDYLRDLGLSKIGCIKVLVDLGVKSLAEAKIVVHESKTWSDRRKADEEFHRQIEDLSE